VSWSSTATGCWGTIDEAEDAVQEAFARAWRGRQTFSRSISLRAWLYRIATNVCLDAIELRKRDRIELGLTIGPNPDRMLIGVSQPEAGPEARYDAHEARRAKTNRWAIAAIPSSAP
jgi:RNA polymerase sigma-70 factor (ECF subfamily)